MVVGRSAGRKGFESECKDGLTFLFLLSDEKFNWKNWIYYEEVLLNYIMTEFCYYAASTSLIPQGRIFRITQSEEVDEIQSIRLCF